MNEHDDDAPREHDENADEQAPAPELGDAASLDHPAPLPPDEPRRPAWTWFPTPIAVLIGAAAIVAAIVVTDDEPAPAEPVAPALAELSDAVDALAEEVRQAPPAATRAPAATAAPAPTPAAPSVPVTLREAIDGYAAALGLDAARFAECLADPATYEAVGAQLQRGIDLGVNGTPTFFVNNKMISGAQPAALFAEVIEAELAGGPLSLDAYSEGIRQLAARDPPGFAILAEAPDAGGAPIEGSADAPVMIVEFSDFECPFCQRWYHEALPSIRARVGDDVALAFLHFPLTQIHPNAATAHAAAECAGGQGRFWAMHDLLFERQAEWSRLPNVN